MFQIQFADGTSAAHIRLQQLLPAVQAYLDARGVACTLTMSTLYRMSSTKARKSNDVQELLKHFKVCKVPHKRTRVYTLVPALAQPAPAITV